MLVNEQVVKDGVLVPMKLFRDEDSFWEGKCSPLRKQSSSLMSVMSLISCGEALDRGRLCDRWARKGNGVMAAAEDLLLRLDP